MITVCIPNYNHGKFLEKRIHELLAVSDERVSFYVIDDGSTDDSHALLQNIAKNEPRIALRLHRENKGVIARLNEGLLAIQTPYIAFAAVDDWTSPLFFEEILSAIASHPNYGVYTSNFAVGSLDPQGHRKVSKEYVLPEVFCVKPYSKGEVTALFRHTQLFIASNASVFSKKTLDKVGPFNEACGIYTDWVVNHSAALADGIVYIPKTISMWIQHDTNYSTTQTDAQLYEYQVAAVKSVLNESNKALRIRFHQSAILRMIIKRHFTTFIFNYRLWGTLYYLLGRHLKRWIHRCRGCLKI